MILVHIIKHQPDSTPHKSSNLGHAQSELYAIFTIFDSYVISFRNYPDFNGYNMIFPAFTTYICSAASTPNSHPTSALDFTIMERRRKWSTEWVVVKLMLIGETMIECDEDCINYIGC